MSLGPYPNGVNRGEAAIAGRAATSVRRSARHCALPGVGAGQTASTLALCLAPAAATEGAVPRDAAVRATRARDAAIRPVTPVIMTNAGPPRLPENLPPPNHVLARARVYAKPGTATDPLRREVSGDIEDHLGCGPWDRDI